MKNEKISLGKYYYFVKSDIIKNKYYESDYKNITQKLLYENMSYNYVIEQGLALIAKIDIFEYKNEA